MVSLSFTSLTTLIKRQEFSAFTAFLNNRNVALDDRDENGTTALMVAAEMGLPNFISALIEYGASVNLTDLDNWTALHNAAKEGHVSSIAELLDAGANTEAKDLGGWTPLMWAVYRHHEPAVRMLVERGGAAANCSGQQHVTALALASGRGDTQIVQLLLQHGAKPNLNDKFGTSPLIWACRKGYTDIVRHLTAHGANVDASGMYSWTPLLMAVKHGHCDVVQLLIEQRPNLNVVDGDGQTALICAAKDGSLPIVTALVNAGAYINVQDKSGDTCLICASRAGHKNIVDLLLKKYAELNYTGKEHKTALYWAVEKNNVEVVRLLLHAHADTEIATKDGDTPLLKSVRNRNMSLVQLLLANKARITATDRRGDMCLHVAMRARSRKIIEVLLSNPKHSKLLYRPNKANETPYSIDQAHKSPILADIFGARKLNTNEENENRLGYELYSGVLADFLSDPTLSVPISVGLYSKWGSGKSFLLGKLTDEMRLFTHRWLDTQLSVSLFVVGVWLNVTAVATALTAAVATSWWPVAAVAVAVLLLQVLVFVVLSRFGSSWDQKGLYAWNTRLAGCIAYCQLIYRICFCRPPGAKHSDSGSAQIRYFFGERTKVMATGRGDVGVVHILSTLYKDIEQRCGRVACRLYRAFRPVPLSAEAGISWRRVCFVPNLLVFGAVVYLLLCVAVLSVVYARNVFSTEPAVRQMSLTPTGSNGGTGAAASRAPLNASVLASAATATATAAATAASVSPQLVQSLLLPLIVALVVIVCILLLVNGLTIGHVFSSLLSSQTVHFNRLSRLRHCDEDRYVETLKSEVRLLINMVRCLDSFCGEHSRLVVVVDGLDSCEQEKVVEMLDTISALLMTPEAPFVVLLAIDPHIVAKAVEVNINKIFSHTAIGGRDYLRNVIHLPFYLQNTTLRLVNTARRVASVNRWEELPDDLTKSTNRNMTSPRVSIDSAAGVSCQLRAGSALSVAKRMYATRLLSCDSLASNVSTGVNRSGAGLAEESAGLGRVLLTDDYFSEINPRSMRRLMNVIYVSGRLVKAFHIDFNWYHLASWMNLVEQWPYRCVWLILYVEYNDSQVDDTTSLYDLYRRLKPHIPSTRELEPLCECDGDDNKLAKFLLLHRQSLTVGDIRLFLPFTINLDPYVRKAIKENYMDPVDGKLANITSAKTGNSAMTTVADRQQCDRPSGLGASQTGTATVYDTRLPASASAAAATAAGGGTELALPHQVWHSAGDSQMGEPQTASTDLSCPVSLFSSLCPYSWTQLQPAALAYAQQLPGSRSLTGYPVPMAALPVPTPTLPSWCSGDDKLLSSLTVDEVCHLVAELGTINCDHVADYQTLLRRENVNGWVLSACKLSDLKQIVCMSFGDWELFQAAIVKLRNHETQQQLRPAAADGDTCRAQQLQQLQQQQQQLYSQSVTPLRLQVTSDSGKVTAYYSATQDTKTVSVVSTPESVKHSTVTELDKQTLTRRSSDTDSDCSVFDMQTFLIRQQEMRASTFSHTRPVRNALSLTGSLAPPGGRSSSHDNVRASPSLPCDNVSVVINMERFVGDERKLINNKATLADAAAGENGDDANFAFDNAGFSCQSNLRQMMPL